MDFHIFTVGEFHTQESFGVSMLYSAKLANRLAMVVWPSRKIPPGTVIALVGDIRLIPKNPISKNPH